MMKAMDFGYGRFLVGLATSGSFESEIEISIILSSMYKFLSFGCFGIFKNYLPCCSLWMASDFRQNVSQSGLDS